MFDVRFTLLFVRISLSGPDPHGTEKYCATFNPSMNIYNVIEISEHSVSPKYLQIINSIIKGIEQGRISQNYLLPSINELGYELDVSRDTCVRAYRGLM